VFRDASRIFFFFSTNMDLSGMTPVTTKIPNPENTGCRSLRWWPCRDPELSLWWNVPALY